MANILVVDDEMGIRELLSEILGDEGHVVATAENAQQARELRAAAKPWSRTWRFRAMAIRARGSCRGHWLGAGSYRRRARHVPPDRTRALPVRHLIASVAGVNPLVRNFADTFNKAWLNGARVRAPETSKEMCFCSSRSRPSWTRLVRTSFMRCPARWREYSWPL